MRMNHFTRYISCKMNMSTRLPTAPGFSLYLERTRWYARTPEPSPLNEGSARSHEVFQGLVWGHGVKCGLSNGGNLGFWRFTSSFDAKELFTHFPNPNVSRSTDTQPNTVLQQQGHLIFCNDRLFFFDNCTFISQEYFSQHLFQLNHFSTSTPGIQTFFFQNNYTSWK